MRVTDVESFAISIPLDEPVAFATRTVEARDYVVVRVRTDTGLEGVGYSLGYDGSPILADVVSKLLAPIVVDRNPHDTERIWREMFDGTVQIGRKGLVLRAISAVDIALWDVKAKDAGLPLHQYLGSDADSVPAYASGGYYYDDDEGFEALRDEMRAYVDRGHDVVKMKVGRLSFEDEVERVRVARETIGDRRTLLLDANGKWSTKREAVELCDAFGEYDPYFIEEPVMPDSVRLMSELNETLDYPVAAGELEFSRYGFAELLRENAVDVVQPDVTVVGGVTEFLKVAHTAALLDIPVAPHFNWELHAPLLAALENGLWVEYFYRDFGPTVFDEVVEHPLEPDSSGELPISERAGHGVVLSEDALAKYRMN